MLFSKFQAHFAAAGALSLVLAATPAFALESDPVTSPAAGSEKTVSTVTLPDAPSAVLTYSTSSNEAVANFDALMAEPPQQVVQQPQKRTGIPGQELEYDANGKLIPLDQQQPKRILGFMPNFRSVSVGAKVHPPGWKYNFTVATHQAFDWSSFVFLGLTSLSAEGLNEHPALGKGVPGFWGYTWRGFLDKTDGNYLAGWFLPSLLHEDTRYYPLGNKHSIVVRELYVISRQGVTRTYGGHQTPNIAGLGGKVLAQVISRQYYPAGSSDFAVLAEKFGYATMRDVIFTSIREFYPDIAAHYVKHREKKAMQAAAKDAGTATP